MAVAHLKPRTKAFAFVIWRECEANGWDRTSAEIAECLGQPTARVARVVREAGWTSRLRGSETTPNEALPQTLRIDSELTRLDCGRDFDDVPGVAA